MTHPYFCSPTTDELQSCTTKQKTEGSEMTSNDHAVIQWCTEAHYGDRSRAFNFVGGHTSGAIWSSNTIANCCNCNQPPLLAVPIVEVAWQPFVIRTSVLYTSAPLHVSPPKPLDGLLVYWQWTQNFEFFIFVRFSILSVLCGPRTREVRFRL